MSRPAAVLAMLVMAVWVTPPAVAEYRHALVIGNAAYTKAPLASPPHDVRLVGDALERRGFTVTRATDLDAPSLEQTIIRFARTIPTQGTALVWYSGHALPHGTIGKPDADTLLLAIDDNPWKTSLRALLNYFVAEHRPPEHTPTSGAGRTIFILDACHQRPGQRPDGPRGLIPPMGLPAESLVIYSAPFGELTEATPGESPARPSPLAERFAAALDSGRPLDDVLETLAPTKVSTLPAGALLPLQQPASRPVAAAEAFQPGRAAGDEWVNPWGMVFCWCPPGRIAVGSPDDEPGRDDDETRVETEFPAGFWVGKYEITRRELFMLRGGAYLSTGDHKLQPLNRCEEKVSADMLARLNATAPDGWRYDLPTEAEWEYAARAGTLTAYSFGADPSDLVRHGNFADRTLRESLSFGEFAKSYPAKSKEPTYFSDRQTGLFTYAHAEWSDGVAEMAVVGSYLPNPWGLHDVHGNVAECTRTLYDAIRPPPEKADETHVWGRVCKGGSWLSLPASCRSAFRGWTKIAENAIGMRFVLRPVGPDEAVAEAGR